MPGGKLHELLAQRQWDAHAKDFLRRGAAKRLHLEPLPGYAPDLNWMKGLRTT